MFWGYPIAVSLLLFSHTHTDNIYVICQLRSLTRASPAPRVFFSHPVLSLAEEALLSDCQNLSNPNQAVVLSSTWQHHQSHARLQEGGTRHRSCQTLPQPRTRTRLQWWYDQQAWPFDSLYFYTFLQDMPTISQNEIILLLGEHFWGI